MREKKMEACNVEGCLKKPIARDLCRMHYMRMARHGDVNHRRHSVLKDFWDYVQKGADGACWQWLGPLSRDGYGHMTYWQGDGTKTERAHRHSYELLIGPIPEGLTIDHLCLNKACVNPAHMEPVTVAVNLQRGHALRGHRISH